MAAAGSVAEGCAGGAVSGVGAGTGGEEIGAIEGMGSGTAGGALGGKLGGTGEDTGAATLGAACFGTAPPSAIDIRENARSSSNRDVLGSGPRVCDGICESRRGAGADGAGASRPMKAEGSGTEKPVSYTHLTLPTILLV